MTLATPESSVTQPECIEPVRAGFLILHRVSETGAPSGAVYVNSRHIQYMQRDRYYACMTTIFLTDDRFVRCAEPPELILTALEDAR